ncbi:hypothetical protein [Streptomyces sp. NPDC005046]
MTVTRWHCGSYHGNPPPEHRADPPSPTAAPEPLGVEAASALPAAAPTCQRHRVLRTLLRPSTDAERLGRSISLIKNSIKESGLLSEWLGGHFVAIDVPPGTDMSPVFALLQREVDEAGAFWEWADAMPFSATRS